MASGIIFDIKEFSVHDGPGVRQTVFLKGCPLRCAWCHNPEGWETRPQLLIRPRECLHCGACGELCGAGPCTACGRCVPACPARARWICGEVLSAEELAERLRRDSPIYAGMGGGVTFSGGEPLMQPEFLLETASMLEGVHRVLETCGCAEPRVFRSAMEAFDLILMDVKLVDPGSHRKYTGADNGRILHSLAQLTEGGTPFVVRIPLIPGVTDTEENLGAAAALLQGAAALQYVELLPYNQLAGAKYEWLGRVYAPPFDAGRPAAPRHEIFRRYGIESRGG